MVPNKEQMATQAGGAHLQRVPYDISWLVHFLGLTRTNHNTCIHVLVHVHSTTTTHSYSTTLRGRTNNNQPVLVVDTPLLHTT